MVPWDPHESAPNGITIGSAVFVGRDQQTNTRTDRPTDTQADHATPSVAIACIHAMHAMQPNNNNNNEDA